MVAAGQEAHKAQAGIQRTLHGARELLGFAENDDQVPEQRREERRRYTAKMGLNFDKATGKIAPRLFSVFSSSIPFFSLAGTRVQMASRLDSGLHTIPH